MTIRSRAWGRLGRAQQTTACGIAIWCLSSPSGTLIRQTGEVHAIEALMEPAFYTFERVQKQTATGSTVEVWFRDRNHATALYEKVIYDHDRVALYESFQNQIGEHYVLQVSDGRGNFQVDRQGRARRSEETWGEDSLIVDQLPEHVRGHWKDLLSGESVGFRFAVISRGETVGFRMSATRKATPDGQPAVVVRLRPRNFIVALFVPPTDMVFRDDDAKTLLEVTGLLPVKLSKRGKWVDFSGRLVFAEGRGESGSPVGSWSGKRAASGTGRGT